MASPRPVVVVTGAGAGAGRAIAARFGRERWRVALLSREPDRLEAARREIEASGGQAMVLPTDMADAAAVFAARDRVVAEWGGIDAWVNCAMATIVGEMICPPALDRVVARSGYQQQISNVPEKAGRPDNLYEPVKSPVGARGRFSDRAKPRAFILNSSHARIAAGAMLLLSFAATAAGGFLAGRRR